MSETNATPGEAADYAPELLLNALPQAILVLGDDNAVLQCNATTEALFHTSESHLKRLRMEDLVAFSSPLLTLVKQVRDSGASVAEYDLRLSSPRTLGEQTTSAFASPLGSPGSRNNNVLLVLQPRGVAQLIDRHMTHRSAARSMSGLAGLLAHEIKNPLSGIRGAAQLIEPALDDDGRMLTQIICTETDRICELVDSMSVFGDERPPTLAPLNVHSVLEHVRTLAVNGFASHLRIEEQYDPSLPPVLGDRDRLIQLLLNLLKNAAEAIDGTRRDGRLRLTTAFRPGVRLTLPGSRERVSLPLLVEVADNGPGVPDDLRAHLFDPFVTNKANGTGLGLALAAKIVREHGGAIECDSSEEGTTFRILFPLQRPPELENRTPEIGDEQ